MGVAMVSVSAAFTGIMAVARVAALAIRKERRVVVMAVPLVLGFGRDPKRGVRHLAKPKRLWIDTQMTFHRLNTTVGKAYGVNEAR